MAFLGLDIAGAAELFGRSERSVFYWVNLDGDGPPDHIALAMTAMVNGEMPATRRSVAAFLERCGKTRRDGDRYKHKNGDRT